MKLPKLSKDQRENRKLLKHLSTFKVGIIASENRIADPDYIHIYPSKGEGRDFMIISYRGLIVPLYLNTVKKALESEGYNLINNKRL
jgi:hypothetical protein